MTRSYDALTGLLTGETYGDGTPSITAVYNHLGQLTGIPDASGTRASPTTSTEKWKGKVRWDL